MGIYARGVMVAVVAAVCFGCETRTGPSTQPGQPPAVVEYPPIEAALFPSPVVHSLRHYSLEYRPMPILVWGGDEARVLRAIHVLKLEECGWVTEVETFIGLVPGDLVEADIELWTSHGHLIRARSYHRAVSSDYEAWENPIIFANDARPYLCDLRAVIVGRVTGHNSDPDETNKRFGELSALMHWAARFKVLTTEDISH